MKKVEQGDLLRVSGIKQPVMVVSNNFFCQSGKAIVCPVLPEAPEGPLHILIQTEQLNGYVLCEQVRYLDLSARSFTKIGSACNFDTMNISDAVMGMFDYQTG